MAGKYAEGEIRDWKNLIFELLRPEDDAAILEFKIHDPAEEKALADTAQKALFQINEKKYAETLSTKGMPEGRIRKYGFALEGKSTDWIRIESKKDL